MCTKPNRASIRTSIAAVADAATSLVTALAVLAVALLVVPATGLARRVAVRSRVTVQVLLDDPGSSRAAYRIVATGLAHAAKTWAPVHLPIDRVVVGAGVHFPPAGRVDVYGAYPAPPSVANASQMALVVVTLGVRDGDRDLEPAELMGVLAHQIRSVMAERYPRFAAHAGQEIATAAHHGRPETGDSQLPSTVIASASTSGSARPASSPAIGAGAPVLPVSDEDTLTVFADSPQLAVSTNNTSR